MTISIHQINDFTRKRQIPTRSKIQEDLVYVLEGESFETYLKSIFSPPLDLSFELIENELLNNLEKKIGKTRLDELINELQNIIGEKKIGKLFRKFEKTIGVGKGILKEIIFGENQKRFIALLGKEHHNVGNIKIWFLFVGGQIIYIISTPKRTHYKFKIGEEDKINHTPLKNKALKVLEQLFEI